MSRVAFFTDSYHEANGVARTAHALEGYAARRGLPFLCVHGGDRTRIIQDGRTTHVELKRSGIGSFGLEHDLRFDLLLWRHAGLVARALERFAPDVLHFTGPSDVGQLGAYLGHRMSIPMVGSWHTNLHEYASRRLLNRLRWLSEDRRLSTRYWVERQALWMTLQFYRIPQLILAPNVDLCELLRRRTGKPTHEMSRGIDSVLFTPAKRRRYDSAVNVGFVGRLSPEKSVRVLAAVERALARAAGVPFRLTVIGEGSEGPWLRRHLASAEFPGVLRGEALAHAYANMDLFVFPSETETVGNVVLEALASGVPVVAMARGGPRFIAADGASAVLAHNHAELVDATLALVRDPARRQRMAPAARALALTRSWDAIFDRVYLAYDTIARSPYRRRQPEAEEQVAQAAGGPAA